LLLPVRCPYGFDACHVALVLVLLGLMRNPYVDQCKFRFLYMCYEWYHILISCDWTVMSVYLVVPRWYSAYVIQRLTSFVLRRLWSLGTPLLQQQFFGY
jgi:hypothetical protein